MQHFTEKELQRQCLFALNQDSTAIERDEESVDQHLVKDAMH